MKVIPRMSMAIALIVLATLAVGATFAYKHFKNSNFPNLTEEEIKQVCVYGTAAEMREMLEMPEEMELNGVTIYPRRAGQRALDVMAQECPERL